MLTVVPAIAKPGDLVFCESRGTIGRAIRLGERLRRPAVWLAGALTTFAVIAPFLCGAAGPALALTSVLLLAPVLAYLYTEASTRAWKPNHVAVVDDDTRFVLQAQARGVSRAPLDTVAPGGKYVVVPCPFPALPEEVVKFMRLQVGERYGFLTIASIALDILTPKFVSLRRDGTWICSAVAAEALRFAGWYHTWGDVYEVMPSDLWRAIPQ